MGVSSLLPLLQGLPPGLPLLHWSTWWWCGGSEGAWSASPGWSGTALLPWGLCFPGGLTSHWLAEIAVWRLWTGSGLSGGWVLGCRVLGCRVLGCGSGAPCCSRCAGRRTPLSSVADRLLTVVLALTFRDGLKQSWGITLPAFSTIFGTPAQWVNPRPPISTSLLA